MKRIMMLALIFATAVGCAGPTKRFTLTVDPPDAEITVITREGQPGKSYHSPAAVSVSLPKEPEIAAHGRVVISRNNYKTTEIKLNSVQGNSLNITLTKAFRYRLTYSLLRPVRSGDLAFQDRALAVRIVPREKHIDLMIDNLSHKPVSVLWDKADYTDVMNRQNRVILSRIKMQNRGNPIPPQVIPPGESLHESIMPERSIVYMGGDKGYVAKPLFSLDDDSAFQLKGRTFSIFLPVEIDRMTIPDYNFKIRIEDVIKEKN